MRSIRPFFLALLIALLPCSVQAAQINPNTQIQGITGQQGNGALLQHSTGTATSGHCVQFDANGNTVDAGAVCGTSGTIYDSSVYHIQSGTGGATTTLQVDMDARVSVLNWTGVDNTGATDSTTGFQNAINYLQGATRGVLYIPCGTYLLNNGLSITSTISIIGAARTCVNITWTSLTVTVIAIASYDEVHFSGITFTGPTSGGVSTSTAGAVIALNGTGGSPNRNSTIEDCAFWWGYYDLYTTSAYWWKYINNFSWGAANYAIYISNTTQPDWGDNIIAGNNMSYPTVGNIYQVSSGGVRVENNKIIGGQIGYYMVLGSSISTSDLFFVGNSLENQTLVAIRLDNTSNGSFGNVIISANQFSTATGIKAIRAKDVTGTNFLKSMVITGNTISNTSASIAGLIDIDKVDKLAIFGNQMSGGGGTSKAIVIGSGVTNCNISANNFISWGTNILDASSVCRIGATELASTSTPIDVSAAAAPSTGQLLTATSSTTATWQALGTVTNLMLGKTVTAAGTTGARTINKASGSVNFAASATSLVWTDSLVDVNSVINCTVAANDSTMKSVVVVAAAGSFTIYPNAAPTAETRVNCVITN